MNVERKRRRETFMEQSRLYVFAKEPTSEQLHALVQSFAEMVSCDRGERVQVMIGRVAINRENVST
ncbi:hypothetical protein [Paraburkholderia nodosa]|uniref:hypothetical protein n=1 Tax=Paraburkholderia nodosa TaxID=392320 RepID=UPI0004878B55|nr:hypothetical protein [Paraburkholderia nodosa]